MEQTPKQQIIETLKAAESVVVTTSQNPSVDQAASVIALTEMLRDVDKKAVAAFNPETNKRVSFLNPAQFADSQLATVRDFILELDESSAKVDQFRYDRQDNKLRIFITPKQGSFTENDVTTTEGDFNVDTLITLGVSNQGDLFNIVAEHNQLVSKTKVLSLSTGSNRSNIPGATVWHENDASSLAELLVGVGEALGADLNKQTSTALLTGIMAETHNFTSDKTSPKVMTMAAQLMAAGANQQQIVQNLNVPEKPETPIPQEQPSQQPKPEIEQSQPQQQPQKTEEPQQPVVEPTQPAAKPAPQEEPAPQPQQNEQPQQAPSAQPVPSPSEPQEQEVASPEPVQENPTPESDQAAAYTKPDTSQEFSVNSDGQIVTSNPSQQQDQQPQQDRPKPPEPQDAPSQQPKEQSEAPKQDEDTVPEPDTLNQARDAVQQAFSGGNESSPPNENAPMDEHPMINTDRTYRKEQGAQGSQDPSQAPPNPFNSAGTPEDGSGGSNNPIL